MLYTFKVDKFLNSTSVVTDDDKKFLRNWQRLVTNFVKYANPTPVPTSGNFFWKPAQDSRAACVYLDIGQDIREKHRMFPERMELWNRIVYQKMLEKYAVSEEENQLMVGIDFIFADMDRYDDDTYGYDDDVDIKEDTDEDDEKRLPRKWKMVKKGGKKHLQKIRRNKEKFMRKRMRLAKKLRGLKCRH